MDSHSANLIALGGHAKAVRDALKKLGMRRCSLRLVYYQTEPGNGLRLDWYGRFKRWLHALWVVNPGGAEFLLDDLLSFVAQLRRADVTNSNCSWREQLVRCEAVRSGVIKAALVNDIAQLRRKTLEHMAEERRLVAMIDAEVSGAARSAA